MEASYISCADTAKLVRAALKRNFPGIKFSVRSHVYSMGASINVDWTDGPTAGLVDGVVSQYKGGDFDGSIDLKICVYHWLRPDGTAFTASNSGTEGSGGRIAAERNWMPEPGCELVRFCADFIFTKRSMSPAFAQRVLDKARDRFGDMDLQLHVSKHDGSASLQGSYDSERRAYEVASRLVIVRAA